MENLKHEVLGRRHAQVEVAKMDALIDLSEERQSVGARLRSQLQTQRQKIAFYSGHICERGTDTALFDYADCAESELRMCSYVLYDVDSA